MRSDAVMIAIERLLILVIGIIIGSLFSSDINTLIDTNLSESENEQIVVSSLTNPEKLSQMITKDFELLELQSELPKDWNSLKEVKLVSTSKKSELYLMESKPNLQIADSGRFQLELIYIDYKDEEGTGFMIQSSLIDLKSKNKIWEMVRPFNLPDN